MYIPRDIKKKFDKINRSYNLIAVVGARQAGKTTFLKEQMKSKHSSYILFDDPDARSLFNEDIKKFDLQYIEGFELSVLDEVQYCKDAGSKLKYLVDIDGDGEWDYIYDLLDGGIEPYQKETEATDVSYLNYILLLVIILIIVILAIMIIKKKPGGGKKND